MQNGTQWAMCDTEHDSCRVVECVLVLFNRALLAMVIVTLFRRAAAPFDFLGLIAADLRSYCYCNVKVDRDIFPSVLLAP